MLALRFRRLRLGLGMKVPADLGVVNKPVGQAALVTGRPLPARSAPVRAGIARGLAGAARAGRQREGARAFPCEHNRHSAARNRPGFCRCYQRAVGRFRVETVPGDPLGRWLFGDNDGLTRGLHLGAEADGRRNSRNDPYLHAAR